MRVRGRISSKIHDLTLSSTHIDCPSYERRTATGREMEITPIAVTETGESISPQHLRLYWDIIDITPDEATDFAAAGYSKKQLGVR